MNWKFDFSPDTSDMMGNWSLGECRLVVLVVGGWCRGCREKFEILGGGEPLRLLLLVGSMWALGQPSRASILSRP